MRKRPTPETDAVAAYEGNWDTKALRMTAHARKLERERDEALMDRARCETATITINHYERILRERDEAREIIKIVAQDKDKIIEQLIVERDSAREIYKTLHSLYADEIVKNRNI